MPTIFEASLHRPTITSVALTAAILMCVLLSPAQLASAASPSSTNNNNNNVQDHRQPLPFSKQGLGLHSLVGGTVGEAVNRGGASAADDSNHLHIKIGEAKWVHRGESGKEELRMARQGDILQARINLVDNDNVTQSNLQHAAGSSNTAEESVFLSVLINIGHTVLTHRPENCTLVTPYRLNITEAHLTDQELRELQLKVAGIERGTTQYESRRHEYLRYAAYMRTLAKNEQGASGSLWRCRVGVTDRPSSWQFSIVLLPTVLLPPNGVTVHAFLESSYHPAVAAATMTEMSLRDDFVQYLRHEGSISLIHQRTHCILRSHINFNEDGPTSIKFLAEKRLLAKLGRQDVVDKKMQLPLNQRLIGGDAASELIGHEKALRETIGEVLDELILGTAVAKTDPPLNRATFGSVVQFTSHAMDGSLMHNILPARMNLGPFVLHRVDDEEEIERFGDPLKLDDDGDVDAGDDERSSQNNRRHPTTKGKKKAKAGVSTVLYRMPSRRPGSARMPCPIPPSGTLLHAVIASQSTQEDGMYASAIFNSNTYDHLAPMFCDSIPRGWKPDSFDLSMSGRILSAPQFHDPLVLLDGKSVMANPTFVSGKMHDLTVQLPEKAPFFAFTKIVNSELMRGFSPDETIGGEQLAEIKKSKDEGKKKKQQAGKKKRKKAEESSPAERELSRTMLEVYPPRSTTVVQFIRDGDAGPDPYIEGALTTFYKGSFSIDGNVARKVHMSINVAVHGRHRVHKWPFVLHATSTNVNVTLAKHANYTFTATISSLADGATSTVLNPKLSFRLLHRPTQRFQWRALVLRRSMQQQALLNTINTDDDGAVEAELAAASQWGVTPGMHGDECKGGGPGSKSNELLNCLVLTVNLPDVDVSRMRKVSKVTIQLQLLDNIDDDDVSFEVVSGLHFSNALRTSDESGTVDHSDPIPIPQGGTGGIPLILDSIYFSKTKQFVKANSHYSSSSSSSASDADDPTQRLLSTPEHFTEGGPAGTPLQLSKKKSGTVFNLKLRTRSDEEEDIDGDAAILEGAKGDVPQTATDYHDNRIQPLAPNMLDLLDDEDDFVLSDESYEPPAEDRRQQQQQEEEERRKQAVLNAKNIGEHFPQQQNTPRPPRPDFITTSMIATMDFVLVRMGGGWWQWAAALVVEYLVFVIVSLLLIVKNRSVSDRLGEEGGHTPLAPIEPSTPSFSGSSKISPLAGSLCQLFHRHPYMSFFLGLVGMAKKLHRQDGRAQRGSPAGSPTQQRNTTFPNQRQVETNPATNLRQKAFMLSRRPAVVLGWSSFAIGSVCATATTLFIVLLCLDHDPRESFQSSQRHHTNSDSLARTPSLIHHAMLHFALSGSTTSPEVFFRCIAALPGLCLLVPGLLAVVARYLVEAPYAPQHDPTVNEQVLLRLNLCNGLAHVVSLINIFILHQWNLPPDGFVLLMGSVLGGCLVDALVCQLGVGAVGYVFPTKTGLARAIFVSEDELAAAAALDLHQQDATPAKPAAPTASPPSGNHAKTTPPSKKKH